MADLAHGPLDLGRLATDSPPPAISWFCLACPFAGWRRRWFSRPTRGGIHLLDARVHGAILRVYVV
eukprot:5802115-Prorocentrum_lima.AAC.1